MSHKLFCIYRNILVMSAIFALLSGCKNRQLTNLSASNTVDINIQTYYFSLNSHNLEYIKENVENGADINSVYGGFPLAKEMHPLSVVISNDSQDSIIEYLIKEGADINYLDSNGLSLLMYASGASNYDSNISVSDYICDLLIKNGIEINKKARMDTLL